MPPSLLFLKKKLRRKAERSKPLSFHQNLRDNSLSTMSLVPPTVNLTLNKYFPMANIASPRVEISTLNVKGFKLEQLGAKIANGFIVINGYHGEKRDKYGFISRMFTRRISIPRNIIEDEIKIELTPGDILLVTGKKRAETWMVPIKQINLPALSQNINQSVFRPEIDHINPTMFNLEFLDTYLENVQKYFAASGRQCI